MDISILRLIVLPILFISLCLMVFNIVFGFNPFKKLKKKREVSSKCDAIMPFFTAQANSHPKRNEEVRPCFMSPTYPYHGSAGSVKPCSGKFSVKEYLERFEKENLKIIEERKKEPEYSITLWFGLKGLRQSENGALKWIERKPDTAEINKPLISAVNQNIRQIPLGIENIYGSFRDMYEAEIIRSMTNVRVNEQMNKLIQSIDTQNRCINSRYFNSQIVSPYSSVNQCQNAILTMPDDITICVQSEKHYKQ